MRKNFGRTEAPYVNQQYCGTWGTENPHADIEKPKTSNFLLQKHNWVIVLRKKTVTLSDQVERFFRTQIPKK